MSTIRVIYFPRPDGSRADPGFPATDQHPQAVRYPFDHPTKGLLNVDALGGAPSQAEIDAQLGIDAASVAAAAAAASIDAAIHGATYGGVQPATIAQLKAMDNATYSAWYDANVTTAAQAMALLKLLTRIIIRRVL